MRQVNGDAKPGDVVELAAGRYELIDGLSLDVDDVTVKGAGPEATVLSFNGQKGAGEGLLITSDRVTVRDLVIRQAQASGVAFDRVSLRPRVLREVRPTDLTTTLLGRTLPFPILLAPTAYHRVIHSEGELATACGAGKVGATWVVSTGSNFAIEEIAAVGSAPLWFQLYVQSDREATRRLVRRVEDAFARHRRAKERFAGRPAQWPDTAWVG